MAETARDLITGALLDIGVLADGETPSAAQAAGALRKLNNLIESWNTEQLSVYGASEYVLPLTGGVGTYTLGAGGTFNMPRPNFVESAYLRNTALSPANRYDFPLYIYNDAEYQDVRIKSLTGSLPQGIYFNYTYPLVSVSLFPVPSTSEYSLVIYVSGIIGVLTLDSTVDLAPGYKRALESNLSMELAASYGVSVSESTALIARSSKSTLKAKNLQIDELVIDRNLAGGRFNIYTGYTGR